MTINSPLTDGPGQGMPPLDGYGLLPPGVHSVTLAEIEERFGQVRRSTRRVELFNHLRRFVEEVRKAGFATELRIDGSFVMSQVEEPNDIDVVLVMKADWDLAAQEIKPFEYNLLSRKRTSRSFQIEVYSVLPDFADDPDGMSAFFEQVNPRWTDLYKWPRGLRKGILRVVL